MQNFVSFLEPPKKKSPPRSPPVGDTIPGQTKMFTLAEINQIRQNRKSNLNKSAISRRPLRCPHTNCQRYIGISDLIPHFQHEHLDIPILKTVLEERLPFTFFPKHIQSGTQKCIALLKIATQKPKTANVNRR